MKTQMALSGNTYLKGTDCSDVTKKKIKWSDSKLNNHLRKKTQLPHSK